ncbi:MAG: universal stress protein [Hyphomicrobiaceae bacterium]
MIKRIVHPTDLSPEGDAAFSHALRLAVEFRCRFDVLHVRTINDQENWAEFPHVRETLARWGLLSEDASPDDIEAQLGVALRKIEIAQHDALRGICTFLTSSPPDLIVLETHSASGLTRWLSGSVSENIVRRTRIPTLFIGTNTRPFVDLESGALQLNTVLVPLARNPSPRGALQILSALLDRLTARIEAVHIGDVAPWILDKSGEPIDVRLLQGPVVESILEATKTVDMIAMPTEGRHGFLDALRGSTTERVLHQAGCPMLAIPA